MQTEMRQLSRLKRLDWDQFCARHHASYHCLSNSFSVIGGPVKWFEFYLPGRPERIAQCAVRVRGNTVQFLDSLVIDRDHFEHAAACVESVLEAVAPPAATVAYGSPWNIQPSLAGPLRELPGVGGLEETGYLVDAIDLAEHADEESLFRSFNGTLRRDIRRGEKSAPRMQDYVGARCVLQIPRMLALHRNTYRRKGLRHRWTANFFSLLSKSLAFGDRATISLVEHQRQLYAGAFALQHDSMFFWLRGGSLPNKLGLSHFQHWSLIRECLRRGQHFYVMGYAYEKDLESPELAAQRTFKKRFRSREYPGSILRFQRAA